MIPYPEILEPEVESEVFADGAVMAQAYISGDFVTFYRRDDDLLWIDKGDAEIDGVEFVPATDKLIKGYVYRCVYKVAAQALFLVDVQRLNGTFLDQGQVEVEAESLGIEMAPVYFYTDKPVPYPKPVVYKNHKQGTFQKGGGA